MSAIITLSSVTSYFNIEKKVNNYLSPAGNRTPVSRVTGGDTHHYTTEECDACILLLNILSVRAFNLSKYYGN